MNKNKMTIIYLALMVIVIVAVDLLFFRHKFRERLFANVVIVIGFIILFLVIFKNR